MGYLDQCSACDRGEHGLCDGTVSVHDQDGPGSRYVCRCLHRREYLAAQRVSEAEARVRRLMRELGIDRSHVLTLRDADPLAMASNTDVSGSSRVP